MVNPQVSALRGRSARGSGKGQRGRGWNPTKNAIGTMANGPSPSEVAIAGIGCIPQGICGSLDPLYRP